MLQQNMPQFIHSQKQKHVNNESDIDDVFESIYTTVIANLEDNVNISKYNSLAGNSYIKLPKELDHPRKELINIQNIDDNECSKRCLVRYLHPADHNPRRITKSDKYFAKKLDLKEIKIPVKVRDIHKV